MRGKFSLPGWRNISQCGGKFFSCRDGKYFRCSGIFLCRAGNVRKKRKTPCFFQEQGRFRAEAVIYVYNETGGRMVSGGLRKGGVEHTYITAGSREHDIYETPGGTGEYI